MMISTRACSICGELKPFPADFITSFVKNTMSSQCAHCRSEKGKMSKKKIMGKSLPPPSWATSKRRD